MKKIALIFLILLLSWPMTTRAQKREMQTLVNSNGFTHNGFFFAPVIRVSSINDEVAFLPGFRGAWTINRAVSLGFEGYGLAPTIQQDNIVPGQSVRPLMGYGGFFIEPIIQSNRVVHFTFPVMFGAGWVGYIEDWSDRELLDDPTDELIDDEIIWVIEPGANVEVNIARFFRVDVGVGYRFTQDVKLVNTSPSGFRGFNYSLGLKFGRF